MAQRAAEREVAGVIAATCVGTRVARLHRVVARVYEQALQSVGLSLPQMEILTALTIAPGPMRPADLAATSMLERSTVSRNLTLMQERGWVAAVETSSTGRSMAVGIADTGVAVLAEARTAWQSAQTHLTETLGPDVAPTVDRWLDLLAQQPDEAPRRTSY